MVPYWGQPSTCYLAIQLEKSTKCPAGQIVKYKLNKKQILRGIPIVRIAYLPTSLHKRSFTVIPSRFRSDSIRSCKLLEKIPVRN